MPLCRMILAVRMKNCHLLESSVYRDDSVRSIIDEYVHEKRFVDEDLNEELQFNQEVSILWKG